MSEELGPAPREQGRHGRLSPDYLKVSSSPDAAGLSLDEDHSPPVSAAGRLGADYQRAVAELVNNPAAFFQVVVDERFDGGAPGWANDPRTGVRLVPAGYRLTPPIDNQVLVIGAPVESSLRDVLIGATFRKLGNASGGVFGLFLRDNGPGPRDGRNQGGHYYVAQVDDRGEVGIWRREREGWVELAPWTPSASLRPAPASNDVSFEVVGGRLTFIVNGTPAASAHDTVLDHGGVGLIAAGIGNDVLVERYVVHALD
jgi:hypothetical protein